MSIKYLKYLNQATGLEILTSDTQKKRQLLDRVEHLSMKNFAVTTVLK